VDETAPFLFDSRRVEQASGESVVMRLPSVVLCVGVVGVAILAPAGPLQAVLPGNAAHMGCELTGRDIRGEARAVVGTRFSGAKGFTGAIQIEARDVPSDFRTVMLSSDHVTHTWMHDRDFKLMAYKERQDGLFAAAELVLETREKPKTDGEYVGTFLLRVTYTIDQPYIDTAMITLRGTAVCSAG
jgi:hypothetical protein